MRRRRQTDGDTPVDIGALMDEEIARLQERERRGRDEGASTFLDKVRATRGAWRMRAEDRTLLRWIAPRAHERALDAGSGVGRQAVVVAPQVRHLTCVDFSEAALTELAGEAARRGITNLETRVGDLCALPAFPGRFDLVYSSETIQHIPSAQGRLAAMRGLHDALESGGRCVVNVLCMGWRSRGPQDGFWGSAEEGCYRHLFTPRELRALFVEAGFRQVALHGMLFLPGALTRRLPLSWSALESGLSGLPGLAGAGRFVIGVGRA